jgi:IS1 family transposase
MTDEWTLVRHEYAERLGLQSLQMLLVAANANDVTMRDELRAYAERMSDHAQWLRDSQPRLAARRG